MSRPVPPRGQALLDSLASLRLTVFLLLILAVTSIIGTVMPQGEVPHQYLHGLSPLKLSIYQALDLFDMYHSWWFVVMLAAGIYWTFFVSHRRIRLRISAGELTLAGHSNKHQAAFAATFERVAEAVRNHLALEAKQ